MKEYVLKIVVPFLESTRQKLQLNEGQAALPLFDAFKGQQTELILSLLAQHNIIAVKPNVSRACMITSKTRLYRMASEQLA